MNFVKLVHTFWEGRGLNGLKKCRDSLYQFHWKFSHKYFVFCTRTGGGFEGRPVPEIHPFWTLLFFSESLYCWDCLAFLLLLTLLFLAPLKGVMGRVYDANRWGPDLSHTDTQKVTTLTTGVSEAPGPLKVVLVRPDQTRPDQTCSCWRPWAGDYFFIETRLCVCDPGLYKDCT